MWLATFLLLLDSLHKGRPARACGRRRRRRRGARGWRRGGVPGGGRLGGRPPGTRGCDAPPAPGGLHRGRGRASQPESGQVESPPWTARPATRACRFGAAPGGVMVREPPQLPAPCWAVLPGPSPSPCPPPAAGWRWDPGVPSESRGPPAVTVHLEVLVEPGRGLLPLPPGCPSCRPGPLGPHRMALILALAGCRARRARVPRLGVPRIPSFFSKPRGSLLPAPSHPPPLPQGTSLGFFTWPPGSAPLQKGDSTAFSWSADLGQDLGWGGGGSRAFLGESRLLGVGPGVRHVQTCCWGSAHLILEAAVGGWKWSHIFDQSHLVTKSASGRPRSSTSRRLQRTCPQARGWRERRRPEPPRPLVRSTHARSFELSFTCSAPNFLLRALGTALLHFAQAAALAQLQLLTPRRWGRGQSPGLAPGAVSSPSH